MSTATGKLFLKYCLSKLNENKVLEAQICKESILESLLIGLLCIRKVQVSHLWLLTDTDITDGLYVQL